MFTIAAIHQAHDKVKSGADFPNYIREIKQLGVTAFETRVIDSHTVYFGANDFQIQSEAQYENPRISDFSDAEQFSHYLKIHQKGETDYITFCKHCAETGVEKWFVDIGEMTCKYFDTSGTVVLTESIPQ